MSPALYSNYPINVAVKNAQIFIRTAAAVRFWIKDGILIKGRLEGFVQYSFPKNELSGCSTGTETVSWF